MMDGAYSTQGVKIIHNVFFRTTEGTRALGRPTLGGRELLDIV
jgi:hypothetical protein